MISQGIKLIAAIHKAAYEARKDPISRLSGTSQPD